MSEPKRIPARGRRYATREEARTARRNYRKRWMQDKRRKPVGERYEQFRDTGDIV